MFETNSSG
jgi:hypothetical protein